MLKRLTSNSNFIPLAVVVLFGLLASKGLFGSGYFNMHDDLQIMRQLEMEKCFLTLQIPCRWVPDMGYGFGFPLFNFYPPLPYLIGEVIRIFGVSFVDTIKLVFALAFIASGVTMYFLAKEFWGKLGGIISSAFYIWAPYHSVDVYARGAMNESWGIVFFPQILLMSYLLITKEKNKIWNLILLALGWVGLLLSHNLMAMIFAPVFGFWCIIWVLKNRDFLKLIHLAISGAISLGLVAFFTIPVLVEQKFVNTSSLIVGYYDFSAHFATLRQLLFSRFWGYGPSVWGAHDGMSFQIGWLHWAISIAVTLIIAFTILKKAIKNKKLLKIENWMIVVIYFFVIGWFAVFMVHNKSTPIWINFQTLHYVQFPWRFLTVVILSFSFMAGAIVKFIPKKFVIYFSGILVACMVLYSWNYFMPQFGHLGELTDSQKLKGVAWELQQGAGIYDYLPNTVKTAPIAPMKNFVEVLGGNSKITNINRGTNNNSFNIKVENGTEVRLGLFQFPDWKVFVDKKEVATYVPENEQLGRIHFLIPAGQHSVNVRLQNTPVRTIGNVISIVSWVGLVGYLMLQFKRNEGRKRS